MRWGWAARPVEARRAYVTCKLARGAAAHCYVMYALSSSFQPSGGP